MKEGVKGSESLNQLWEEEDKELRKLLAERRRWFRTLEAEKKQEKLFELEVFLKGLVRFANLSHHPISERGNVLVRDFGAEIEVVKNALGRAVVLISSLLPETQANLLYFQSYVEASLISDYQRSQLLTQAINQRTPIESLYMLNHSLIDLRELASNLLGVELKRYQVFYYLEQMIVREITGSRYFNPFRGLGFIPHYDVVRSSRISKVINQIVDRELRRLFSVIILLLFKLLRYLSLLPPERGSLSQLKDSLLIFALLNSESKLLVDAFEQFIPIRFQEIGFARSSEGKRLLELLDGIAFQLEMEMKKIFELELKDAGAVIEPKILQNGIARSRGLLTNIFQQAIIELCKVFDPSLEGKDVFKDFISRMEQSLKLRRDVWLFAKVLERLEQELDRSESGEDLKQSFEAITTLRNFVYYYQNISFQLVRAYDRDEFQNFFNFLDSANLEELRQSESRVRFKREIHSFRMFLETTFNAINQRAELKELPFGKDEATRLLAQFFQ